MTVPDLPVIRLKPKIKPARLRHGFPWVYDNELVLDRRTRGVTPGRIVRLEDGARRFVGIGAFNPGSRIAVRMLAQDDRLPIDRDWIAMRLQTALGHRETLYDAPFYRLIHAEADGLPGVVVDRFGDIAVIQPNAAWAEVMFDDLVQALADVTGVTTIVKNTSGRARGLEGLDDNGRVVRGAVTGPVAVPMNGATYLADLTGGQKTGLFYDQRPNHAFAAALATDARVLDVFSHVGGFALAALAGGARSALAVDAAAPALDLARQGADLSGVADRFATHEGDAFDSMTALAGDGAQFDLAICDPPAFAPSKQALEAGLRAYEKVARRAASLVAEGGYLVLCSCSHAADLDRFRAACTRGIGRAGRSAQLIHTGFAGPDHPLHPMLAESGYLKVLFYRLLP